MDKLEPAIFVIFGITGNLAQRRILPALYHLFKDDLLPDQTEIVGVSRSTVSVDELLKQVELCVVDTDKICDPAVLSRLRDRLHMVRLDPLKDEDYESLHTTLQTIEDRHGVCMNRLFYLSIPPQVYEPIIRNLGEHHLNEGCKHKKALSRLLVEKPFGYDLESAKELIEATARYFSEEQIFRIDHYLAKETAQNILVFRARNPIFANLWNREYVTNIAITLSEQIGVEGRVNFYDNIGALRDVVQNHVLQLLALTTMELPSTLTNPHALHTAKQQLLDAIQPIDTTQAQVVRAQYKGYREEVGNPGSATETFVSLTLNIDNDRWQDVPIRLTASKALKTKETRVALCFSSPSATTATNKLTFRIQPNEGIDVELVVKRPGFEEKTEIVQMDFSYHGAFNEPEHPDAYERVIVDAVKGDHSLFATSEEVMSSWRILQPVLNAWKNSDHDLLTYEPQSDGPGIV